MKVRILIADDHTIFTSGLKRIIETTIDIVASGVVECGPDLLRDVPSADIDLLLLDLSMPGASGVEIVRKVHALRPELPILVLTMHNEVQLAIWALEQGARGYATKDSDPEALIDGIRRVAQGGRYLSPNIAEAISYLPLDHRRRKADTLSKREWEVLRLLGEGREIGLVAKELHISPKTVSTHKMRLMRKLHLKSNIDLVHYLLRQGLGQKCADCDSPSPECVALMAAEAGHEA